MSLDALVGFLAVVEHGSLLKAAEQLEISRTTLRRRLDALEARAGAQLLVRTRKGAHATEAGHELSRRLSPLLEAAESAISAVGDDGLSGPMSVDLMHGMPPMLAVFVIRLLRDEFPRVNLRITSHDPSANQRPRADLVLTVAGLPPQPGRRAEPLYSSELVLLASADYLRERGAPQSIEELLKRDLLVWQQPNAPVGHLPLVGGGSLATSPLLSSSDILLLRRSAAAGLGIALVPDPGMALTPEDVPLVRVLEGVVKGSADFVLETPLPDLAPPRVRIIASRCREVARALLGQLASNLAP